MAGIQTYRNPKLVRILDKLKFIENYGTGILRTKQEYKMYKMHPEFQDKGNFFVVKLPNLNYNFSVDQSSDEIKSSDEINGDKSDEIKSSDEINEDKIDEIKSSDEINGDKIDEIKSSDEINEDKSDEINEDKSDEITILRKAILLIIKKHPGIKVNEILEQLVCMNIYTSITTIQNQLRRKLSKYVVYKGSRKTGGYYYKKDVN